MQGEAKGDEDDGDAVLGAVGEDGFSKELLRTEGEHLPAEGDTGCGHAADADWFSLMRSSWRAAAACRETRWEDARTVMVSGIGSEHALGWRSTDISGNNKRLRQIGRKSEELRGRGGRQAAAHAKHCRYCARMTKK